MFKQLRNLKTRLYAKLLNDMLKENNSGLTKEDKKVMVDYILSKKPAREVIEKYIRWKVGVRTRAAMREKDDRKTFGLKERASELSEITYDFNAIWDEVHRDEEEEYKKNEEKNKKPFKFFGN